MRKTVELTIVPGQPGFHGECKVLYGPIGLDSLVEQRLIGGIKTSSLELGADGSINSSQCRFDTIFANREEVQFIDSHNGGAKQTMTITKDMTTKTSQQDSLQVTLNAPSYGRHVFDQNRLSGSRAMTIEMSLFCS